MGGPAGAIAGAAVGPMLEPLVRGAWADISESARRRQTDTLYWAVREGLPESELEQRINASERTRLITGFALEASARTAWDDKVHTLGRSLASGLLADDDAKIDTEQMIIAAIADIEGPQLAMLELLVRWYPAQIELLPSLIAGPLDIPGRASSGWHVNMREWPYPLIAYARPNLLPIVPSLLGTLQRHGLIVQNEYTNVEVDRYQNGRFWEELEDAAGVRIAPKQRSGHYHYLYEGRPRVTWPEGEAPLPRWSPTELGEQVFLRFRDAGTQLEDAWSAGPANPQEQP
jgi:hypothetical protein